MLWGGAAHHIRAFQSPCPAATRPHAAPGSAATPLPQRTTPVSASDRCRRTETCQLTFFCTINLACLRLALAPPLTLARPRLQSTLRTPLSSRCPPLAPARSSPPATCQCFLPYQPRHDYAILLSVTERFWDRWGCCTVRAGTPPARVGAVLAPPLSPSGVIAPLIARAQVTIAHSYLSNTHQPPLREKWLLQQP